MAIDRFIRMATPIYEFMSMRNDKSMTFKKLSRDKEEDTRIMAGQDSFTIEQLENEQKLGSDIGIKMKRIEKILQERY